MQRVSTQEVAAEPGEQAFLLQLRPAAPPEADYDTLARQVDQFVGLYLEACGVEIARFAPVGPLTWSICTPAGSRDQIEAVRVDIAETLFGVDDPARVRLSGEDDSASEPATPKAPAEPAVEESDAWEPAHSSAATRAAMDSASDEFDLDAPALDIVDADAFDVDGWSSPNSAYDPGPAAETGIEPTVARDDAGAHEAFDAGALDMDAFDLTEAGGGVAQAPEAPATFESLTEPPEREGTDVAAELAAFRAEMRAIAASIPGAGGEDMIERFRTEIDSATGALGQRVDGAAQRIEAAAERLAGAAALAPEAERMTGAVERAEASARLMETSVRDAVQALTSALAVMRGPASGGDETHSQTGA